MSRWHNAPSHRRQTCCTFPASRRRFANDWQNNLKEPCHFKPGMRIHAINRTINSTPSVNKIRDFSSGILTQLPNVLKMERNMNPVQRQAFATDAGFTARNFTGAAFGFDLRPGRGAKGAFATTVSFLVSSPVPRILMPSERPLD